VGSELMVSEGGSSLGMGGEGRGGLCVQVSTFFVAGDGVRGEGKYCIFGLSEGCRGDLLCGDSEITVGACRYVLKRSVLR
jgi:hypothetical protein